jgi:hypothetical protein
LLALLGAHHILHMSRIRVNCIWTALKVFTNYSKKRKVFLLHAIKAQKGQRDIDPLIPNLDKRHND